MSSDNGNCDHGEIRKRKFRPDDGIEQRTDGSIRRPGAGGRTTSDFLDPSNHGRPITRGDYINLRASEEFSREQSVWWRRALRYVRGLPQVKDVPGRMAAAHGRSLMHLQAAMLERAAAQEQAQEKSQAEAADA